MSELEVLISELLTVDGFTAGSISTGEVSSLDHKVGNDTVELGSLEMKRLSRLSLTLLAGA